MSQTSVFNPKFKPAPKKEGGLSSVAERRLELLVRDVTKSLVAGIRAVLAEDERSVVTDAELFDRQLHDYVTSVVPTQLEDPLSIEREANTPHWESIHGPSGRGPIGRSREFDDGV
jgi:hypothetical protein